MENNNTVQMIHTLEEKLASETKQIQAASLLCQFGTFFIREVACGMLNVHASLLRNENNKEPRIFYK